MTQLTYKIHNDANSVQFVMEIEINQALYTRVGIYQRSLYNRLHHHTTPQLPPSSTTMSQPSPPSVTTSQTSLW